MAIIVRGDKFVPVSNTPDMQAIKSILSGLQQQIDALRTTSTAAGIYASGSFDGSLLGNIAPRAQSGLQSITRTAVGVYAVVFTVSRPDANYKVVGSAGLTGAATAYKFTAYNLTPNGFTISTEATDATAIVFSVTP